MKKYMSIVALSMMVGIVGIGTGYSEMNGNLAETPANQPAPVAGAPQSNPQGIPKLEVEFQSGHAEIPASFSTNLNSFGRYLKNNPGTLVSIVAYADHTGNAPDNAALAQKRADAVQKYLITHYAISADRITARGYGEVTTKPQNSTEAAKQYDRRAFATIVAPNA